MPAELYEWAPPVFLEAVKLVECTMCTFTAGSRPDKSRQTMTIFDRLEHWKEEGAITLEQHAYLSGLSRGEPFSLYIELNVLLYAGVLAFVAGLGWTVTTWSRQLGDVVIVTMLSAILAACSWYCITRATPWSPAETPAPNAIFDYVLYLGSLVWCVELAYVEGRLHMLSGKWDIYLLATAILFFFLAYRFDNRFVLSLALSSFAAWFGLKVSNFPDRQDAVYRESALLYCFVVGAAAVLLHRRGWKPHFLGTYLNVVANLLFWALLSGVFEQSGYGVWLLVLLMACGASLAWGLTQRQFAFVAYAAIYGYIGVSAVLLRNFTGDTVVLTFFVTTAVAMVVMLVMIARNFGRRA
jgi:hypothetical protein